MTLVLLLCDSDLNASIWLFFRMSFVSDLVNISLPLARASASILMALACPSALIFATPLVPVPQLWPLVYHLLLEWLCVPLQVFPFVL